MLSSGLTFDDLSLAGQNIVLAHRKQALAIISRLDTYHTNTLSESEVVVIGN